MRSPKRTRIAPGGGYHESAQRSSRVRNQSASDPITNQEQARHSESSANQINQPTNHAKPQSTNQPTNVAGAKWLKRADRLDARGARRARAPYVRHMTPVKTSLLSRLRWRTR